MLVLTFIGKDRDSGYFKWPLLAVTGTLDYSTDFYCNDRDSELYTDLLWQGKGLWIVTLISSGSGRDFEY